MNTHQYRIYIAEKPGSRRELVVHDYHFQVSASSLVFAWKKADDYLFTPALSVLGREVHISGGRAQYKARRLSVLPLLVGYVGAYPVYVQKLPRLGGVL